MTIHYWVINDLNADWVAHLRWNLWAHSRNYIDRDVILLSGAIFFFIVVFRLICLFLGSIPLFFGLILHRISERLRLDNGGRAYTIIDRAHRLSGLVDANLPRFHPVIRVERHDIDAQCMATLTWWLFRMWLQEEVFVLTGIVGTLKIIPIKVDEQAGLLLSTSLYLGLRDDRAFTGYDKAFFDNAVGCGTETWSHFTRRLLCRTCCRLLPAVPILFHSYFWIKFINRVAIYRQFPSRANKWNDANFTLSDTFLIDWLKRKDVSSVKV